MSHTYIDTFPWGRVHGGQLYTSQVSIYLYKYMYVYIHIISILSYTYIDSLPWERVVDSSVPLK
jgi:hypothetical protein